MTTKFGPTAIRAVRSWSVAPVAPIVRRKDRIDGDFRLAAPSAPSMGAAQPLLAPDAMAVLIQAQARLAA